MLEWSALMIKFMPPVEVTVKLHALLLFSHMFTDTNQTLDTMAVHVLFN